MRLLNIALPIHALLEDRIDIEVHTLLPPLHIRASFTIKNFNEIVRAINTCSTKVTEVGLSCPLWGSATKAKLIIRCVSSL